MNESLNIHDNIHKRLEQYITTNKVPNILFYGENGCGVAERDGVLDKVDFIVGTFSKSLGAMGGFCASNHKVLSRMEEFKRGVLKP